MTGLRILLVEDELSSADVLALILADNGYHVTVAADGRHALARLDEAAPDLLVTDFMMPGMNGGELVQAIRARAAYAAIPVLLMSGAPEAALRGYRVDYTVFLRKPFDIDEFLDAVRRLHGDHDAKPEPRV